ncbi:MAG: phosphoribosylformylglycinamidine synthase subunit PurS [Actinobacteria bacterium]|nr:phosphoribosylformylglycinamidine synthase subunit PurS [Actinomycetota bacterium]
MNVRVYVTPKEGILDPQGATVERALPALGFQGVAAVRIGKFIEFRLEGGNLTRQQTHEQIDDMCRKLLANPIIEDYRFEIDE